MQGGRDTSTFEDRFGDLAALVYKVAFRLTGDRGVAEDLCQEALARAYSSWRRVADHDEAWVARVTTNLAIGRWRKDRRLVVGSGPGSATSTTARPPTPRRDAMFEPLDDPRPPRFDSAFRRRVVRRAHQRRRRRLAGGAGATVVAMVAGAAGLYGPSVWRARDIERVEVAGTQPVASGEPVTVLLLGRDGPRADGPSPVDTILVGRFDPEAGSLSLLSLPRDLMVAGPDGAPVAVREVSDPGALVGVVEAQLGIPLDHVVQVDFDGFAALVDRIGGVEVRVDTATRDRASGLLLDDLGCVTLDGEETLALVRSRKLEYLEPGGTWRQDPLSDLRRVETQRVVLTAVLAGLDALGWSPGEVRDEVEWAAEHLTIDAGLSLDELVRLGSAAAALDPGDVTGATLPVVSYPGDMNRLAADPDRAAAAVAAFVAGNPVPPSAPSAPDEAGPPPIVVTSDPVVAPC